MNLLITGFGNVDVIANSESKATSEAKGGGFGIFNASAFEALASVGDQVDQTIDRASTQAYIAGAQISGAGNMTIDAHSQNVATNNLTSVSIGGAGIGSTSSAGKILEETLAYLGIKTNTGFPANINTRARSVFMQPPTQF